MVSSIRCLPCAVLLVLLSASDASLSSLRAQSIGASTATKENLDLPYDALGDTEAEEDAPEIVSFYGTQLEGDGFFYCIDRSGSMVDSGELDIAKREAVRNVTEFSERVQFGICFFATNAVKYPANGQPAEANPAMKASAINFVQAAGKERGSCPQTGLSTTLRMANASTAKRCVIVYLGDGGGQCNGSDEAAYHKQTIGAITSQNYKRVQINTIGVLDVQPHQERFLRSLASSNGGTYTRINK